MIPNVSSGEAHGLPRKLTAVGTVGDVNQLFTVYEKNWNCPECQQENYASRPRCLRCKKAKPANVNNYVMDPALQALQEGKEIEWQEVIDPTSYQVYYYNKTTGATQWERPAELGVAPLATGWFGRGRAGAGSLYEELNTQYLSRPAIKQKDFIDPKKYTQEGNQEYNVWYGRYVGDHGDKMDKEPATDRCHLDTDAGYTKADALSGTDRKNKRYFCLHFARGQCAKGAECMFYHRIPTPTDDAHTDELFDCFGRQRHNKHKDDMSGVGSFLKPCRTLFVGNLNKTLYASPKDLEDTLWREFAFPRFRLRTSAEFAKEAMMGQSLGVGEGGKRGAEVLSIRWAHDDPNPVAKDSIARADRDALVALMRAKGVSLTPAPFDYPPDYQMPEPKRMRLEDGGGEVAAGWETGQGGQSGVLAYPNTDAQFAQYYQSMGQGGGDGGDGGAVGQSSAEEDKKEALRRLGLLDEDEVVTHGDSSAPAAPASPDGGADSGDEEDGEEGGWERFVDETSGAAYFFNTATGESSWTVPEGYDASKE